MSTEPTPAPERIGPYRVVRRIGAGAMAALYLAEDPATGAAVAIKALALGQGDDTDAELRARFSREAAAAGRLRHPGVVAVLAHGEETGLAWLAMERLPGHDLTRHVTEAGRLPWPQVLEIGAKVAEALAYAHTQGVVHRDIKPANVVLDPARGRVKVTDFGVARVADALRTRTGVVLGTPAYMSPEQIAGLSVDGRSDLYALGVLLYQLLCARLPHEAGTLGELLRQIASRPAPDVRALRPDLPETLSGVIAQALAKQPAQRTTDGSQFAAALRAVAGSVKFSRTDPRHNAAD